MHPCPAPGCHHRVPFDRFACKTHWFRIPQLLRGRLWREWDNNPGADSYWTVRAECLAALGVPVEQIAEMNADVPLGGPGVNAERTKSRDPATAADDCEAVVSEKP